MWVPAKAAHSLAPVGSGVLCVQRESTPPELEGGQPGRVLALCRQLVLFSACTSLDISRDQMLARRPTAACAIVRPGKLLGLVSEHFVTNTRCSVLVFQG